MEFKQDDSCSVQKSSCFLEIPFFKLSLTKGTLYLLSIFFYIWLTQLKTGLFYPFYKLDLLFIYPLWLNIFEES